MVSCDAHAYTARITKIIPLEQPFTVTFVMMEDNEEVDCDDVNFSIHAGFGAFDDDTAMEEPEADAAENEPTDELG